MRARLTALQWLEQLLADDLARLMVSNGLGVLLAKIATAGLSYATFVIFARILSPRDYGFFAVGVGVATVVATMAGFGLTTALLRFLPEYEAQRRSGLAKGVVVFSCALTFAGALAAAVVMQLAAWSMTWIANGQNFSYLACTGLLAAMFALGDLLASILRAGGSVGWALLPRDVVWRIFLVGAAGIAGLTAISLSADAAIGLAAVTLGLVLMVQAAHAWRSLHAIFASRAAFDCRHWSSTALPMWGSAVLFALVQQCDVVVVSLLMSPEDAGRYFAAMRTASLLGLLLIAGNIVSAPVVSRLFHAGDRAGLERFCRLSATCLGVPALLGFLFLVITGRHMLALFDPNIVDAYPALVVLAAGFAFDAASGPTGYFQQMIGRESAWFRTMLATFVLVVPAQLVLTPTFGLLGAALPSALGAVAWNVVAIRRLRTEYGLDCSLLGLLWWPRPREHAWRTT